MPGLLVRRALHVIKVMKDGIGARSRSPPATSSHRNDLWMTQLGGGPGSAPCYVIVSDLRLICKNVNNNVYSAML